jgi:hypothetical protein
LFKRLCSTNQEKKFFDLWQKLDDLTKKASEEIAKKPVSTETRGRASFSGGCWARCSKCQKEKGRCCEDLQPVDSE